MELWTAAEGPRTFVHVAPMSPFLAGTGSEVALKVEFICLLLFMIHARQLLSYTTAHLFYLGRGVSFIGAYPEHEKVC